MEEELLEAAMSRHLAPAPRMLRLVYVVLYLVAVIVGRAWSVATVIAVLVLVVLVLAPELRAHRSARVPAVDDDAAASPETP